MDWRASVRKAQGVYYHLAMRRAAQRGLLRVPDAPELPEEVREWLEAAIAGAELYLEFGSGASTVVAARAGVPTVSVESDVDFAAAVTAALPPGAPVTMTAGGIGRTERWGLPVVKWATPRRVARWRGYTDRAMAEIARRGRFPDLILVDGRFRRRCALVVARAAAEAGATAAMLFDDYADRLYYHSVERYLGAPEMIGRAALFRLSPGSLARPIDEATLDEAAADYR